MNRIDPLEWDSIEHLHHLFAPILERMGFVPTSQLVMARRPKLVEAWINLMRVVFDPDGETSPALRNLVAVVASLSAGCQYCQAHTSSNAERAGVDDAKIAAVWDFESSDLFDEAERSALRFAMAAATVPNGVNDAMVEDMKQHYSENAIVEIMAVIAAFGFLNRWNDSLATGLEDHPLNFARTVLKKTSWHPGKHVTPDE